MDETLHRWMAVGEFTLKVSDVTKVNLNGVARQDIIAACRPGIPVQLKREPKNRRDANTIAVFVTAGQIGFLPADEAARLAPQIDSGDRRFSAILSDVYAIEGDKAAPEGDDLEEIWAAELTITERAPLEEQNFSLLALLADVVLWPKRFFAPPFKRGGRGSFSVLTAVDKLLSRLSGGDRYVLLALWIAVVGLVALLIYILVRQLL